MMTEAVTRDAPAAETATTDEQETETVTIATDDNTREDEIIDVDIPETRASPPEDVAVMAPTSAMRSALEAQRRHATSGGVAPRQTASEETATRAIAERVLREERERVAGITDAARKLGIDTAVAEDLVRRGIGLDEARRSLIDTAAERDRSVETRPHHIRAGGLDEVTTRRAAVENALLHRYDPSRHALSEPARDWRGLSLIEMARSLLEAAGERPRGLSRDARGRRGADGPLANRRRVRAPVPRARTAAGRGKKRLRARAGWHFGGGAAYCDGCARQGRPCARGEPGSDGDLCPYIANEPLTDGGWQAWDVLLRSTRRSPAGSRSTSPPAT